MDPSRHLIESLDQSVVLSRYLLYCLFTLLFLQQAFTEHLSLRDCRYKGD